MTKPPPSPKIPSLIDNPNYKAALTRLSELQRNQDAAQRKRADIEAQIVASSTERSTTKFNELDHAAAALIRGDGNVAMTLTKLREELAEARDHSEIIRRAVKMQTEALEKLRRDVSRDICRQLRPQYCEISRRIGLAWRGLMEAVIAEQAFRLALQEAWVDHDSIPCSVPPGFGNVADYNSAAARFLLRLVEIEYLSTDDVPQNLRPYTAKPQPAPAATRSPAKRPDSADRRNHVGPAVQVS